MKKINFQKMVLDKILRINSLIVSYEFAHKTNADKEKIVK